MFTTLQQETTMYSNCTLLKMYYEEIILFQSFKWTENVWKTWNGAFLCSFNIHVKWKQFFFYLTLNTFLSWVSQMYSFLSIKGINQETHRNFKYLKVSIHSQNSVYFIFYLLYYNRNATINLDFNAQFPLIHIQICVFAF